MTDISVPVSSNSSIASSSSVGGDFFSCYFSSAKILHEILSALNFTKEKKCGVRITPDAMFFFVQSDDKAVQAGVRFMRTHFMSYCYRKELVPSGSQEENCYEFGLNLSIFLDCLALYGTKSENQVKISYSGLHSSYNSSFFFDYYSS